MSARTRKPKRPVPQRVQRLEGYAVYLWGDLSAQIEIPNARWVDDAAELLAEWKEEGSTWSMRLRSPDGVSYAGEFSSPDYEEPTPVAMTRWVSPRGDEWLLQGTLLSEEGHEPWYIVLYPTEGAV